MHLFVTLILSYLISSYLIPSHPISSYLILSHPVSSCLILSHPISSIVHFYIFRFILSLSVQSFLCIYLPILLPVLLPLFLHVKFIVIYEFLHAENCRAAHRHIYIFYKAEGPAPAAAVLSLVSSPGEETQPCHQVEESPSGALPAVTECETEDHGDGHGDASAGAQGGQSASPRARPAAPSPEETQLPHQAARAARAAQSIQIH